MNNQDFEYFQWGTHDNQQQTFYAIANQSVGKFFIVGENYTKFKLVQFITMMTMPTLMVNLSNISNYQNGMLDNSVCLNWGIHSPLGSYTTTGLAADYKSRGIDSLKETNNIGDADLEFQKNLFYISTLLDHTDSFINQRVTLSIDKRHNQELLKYFKILLPNDTALHKMIELDQEKMLDLEQSIKECKNKLIRILSNLDYSVSHQDLRNSLQHELDEFDFGNEDTVSTYKKFIMEKA